MRTVNRRKFLSGMTAVAGGIAAIESTDRQQVGNGSGAPDWLPRQDPALVQETVGVSHRDFDRVRTLGDAVRGEYTFGPGPRDHFVVDVLSDRLGIQRPGSSRQSLHHAGQLVFFPQGPGTVRIAFVRDGGSVPRLTIADREAVFLTARRR